MIQPTVVLNCGLKYALNISSILVINQKPVEVAVTGIIWDDFRL